MVVIGPQFGTIKSYFQNQKIFNQGQIGTVGYLIKKGEVTIYKIINNEKIVLNKLGPGEVFGEMGIITKAPRTACAEASEYCDLVIIDKDTLDMMLNNSPKLIKSITLCLIQRLSNATRMLEHKKKATLSSKMRLSIYGLMEVMAQNELEICHKSFSKKAIAIAQADQNEINAGIIELKDREILELSFKSMKSKLSGSTQQVIHVTDLEYLTREIRILQKRSRLSKIHHQLKLRGLE